MRALTSSAGKIWTKPATWVSVGCTSCKMDWPSKVFQTPSLAICILSFQSVSGVESVAYATVVQHYIAGLHAFTIPTSPQGLVEACIFKAALAFTQDLTCYPAAFFGTDLLNSHSYVVHHVVDGTKEWGNLAEETVVIADVLMWQDSTAVFKCILQNYSFDSNMFHF